MISSPRVAYFTYLMHVQRQLPLTTSATLMQSRNYILSTPPNWQNSISFGSFVSSRPLQCTIEKHIHRSTSSFNWQTTHFLRNFSSSSYSYNNDKPEDRATQNPRWEKFKDDFFEAFAKKLPSIFYAGGGGLLTWAITSWINSNKEQNVESGVTNLSTTDADIENYQPRKDLETQLSNNLPLHRQEGDIKPTRVALTGYTGSGKTALAKHFASKRFEEAGQEFEKGKVCVWLFEAKDEASLKRSYLDFVSQKKFGLDLKDILGNSDFHRSRTILDSDDMKLIQKAIAERLVEINGYVCLIFDDVKKYALIKDYIPSLPGLHVDVVVTTQNSEFFATHEENGKNLSMNDGVVNNLEGNKIFNHYLTNQNINWTDEEIESIIKALKYPRMIKEAATYINLTVRKDSDKPNALNNILNHETEIETEISDILPENSYHMHRLLVEKLLESTLVEKLLESTNDSDVILNILNICSFLSTAPMSIDFIKEIVSYYNSGRRIGYFVDSLLDHSFISVNKTENTFRLHESVQKRHRTWLEHQSEYDIQNILSDYCDVLLKLFNFTRLLNSAENLNVYLEHAEFLVGLYSSFIPSIQEKLREKFMELILTISVYHGWIEDNYAEGVKWANRGIDLYIPEIAQTQTSKVLQARLLMNKALFLLFLDGDHNDYISLTKEAKSIFKQENGSDHEKTITAQLNLVYMLIQNRNKIPHALIEARRLVDEIKQFIPNDLALIDTLLMLEYYESNNFDHVYTQLSHVVSMHNKMEFSLLYANNNLADLVLKNKMYTTEWLNKAKEHLDNNLRLLKSIDKSHYRRIRARTWLLYAKISLLEEDYDSATKYIKKCSAIQSKIYPPQHSDRIEAQEIQRKVEYDLLFIRTESHFRLF